MGYRCISIVSSRSRPDFVEGGEILWKLGNVSSEYCILGHSDCNLNSNARILKIFKLFALGTQKKTLH